MNSSSSVVAGEESRGLGLEVVVLALEDRDHVPGHVLQDLRVRERPALGGDGNWLHVRNLLIRAHTRSEAERRSEDGPNGID